MFEFTRLYLKECFFTYLQSFCLSYTGSFRKSLSGSPPSTVRYEKWAMPFQFKCIGTLRYEHIEPNSFLIHHIKHVFSPLRPLFAACLLRGYVLVFRGQIPHERWAGLLARSCLRPASCHPPLLGFTRKIGYLRKTLTGGSSLIEMVLLSTHNIWFGRERRKLFSK